MIYTLTLNPAFDIHAQTGEFLPFHENLAHITSREAGGKGVNLSRGLSAAGVANRAVILLGRENGAEFRKALNGLDCQFIETEGRIRENLTIHSTNQPETRISFPGFQASGALLDGIAVEPGSIITVTGRTAVPVADVKVFLKGLDAKIVIDSRSFSLEDLYDVQPWLVKPNQEELQAYLGDIAPLDAAKKMAEHGIENVMISLGGDGAILYHQGKAYHAAAPKITPVSTVGAGDSMIAGFLTAFSRGRTPAECLATAVAFGSAACLTEGTQPPDMKAVENFLHEIAVTELPA